MLAKWCGLKCGIVESLAEYSLCGAFGCCRENWFRHPVLTCSLGKGATSMRKREAGGNGVAVERKISE